MKGVEDSHPWEFRELLPREWLFLWEKDRRSVLPEGQLCAHLCPPVGVSEGAEPIQTAWALWLDSPSILSMPVTVACLLLGPVMGKREQGRERRTPVSTKASLWLKS